MRSHNPEASDCGSITLVSYIPGPLGALLHDLGRLIPGDRNPQPHVTILPPRPLRSMVETASQQAREVLKKFPSFEVELTLVREFPQTKMLYLGVGDGGPSLHRLHAALNTGDLQHTERFDFMPHLTLGGPIPDHSMTTARELAESIWQSVNGPARFTVSEIVCLWLSPGAPWGAWQRLWIQSLRIGAEKPVGAATARTY